MCFHIYIVPYKAQYVNKKVSYKVQKMNKNLSFYKNRQKQKVFKEDDEVLSMREFGSYLFFDPVDSGLHK